MGESEEKKFLHDISGPVGSAIFLLDILLEEMRSRPDVIQDELTQIQQVFDLLGRIKGEIESRRKVLA